jgi:sterol desaturase/sphingolipid hydroxylase (fatty acid hydroxylase superfamily)
MALAGLPNFTALAEELRLGDLSRSALVGSAILLSALLMSMVAERRQGLSAQRLWSRNFLTDVAWALFYRSGLYVMFILSVTTTALGSRLDFMRLELFPHLPSIIAVPIYLVLGDLILYWVHRLQHAIPALWAFHAVHHSQEQLNTLTQYRRHPLEMLYAQVAMFVVFVPVLGIPMRTWIALYAVLVALQALQHAELNWRFGRLYSFVVSPVFHGIHHSTDPAHANRNFGAMFSFWDYLFGTALDGVRRPARYGAPGIQMKESFWAQLVMPFGLLFGRGSRTEATTAQQVPSASPGATRTPVS